MRDQRRVIRSAPLTQLAATGAIDPEAELVVAVIGREHELGEEDSLIRWQRRRFR